MTNILGKLFGSDHRVKIMRQFLFHPRTAYDVDVLAKHTGVTKPNVRKETKLLKDIGFLRSKSFSKTVTLKSGKTKKQRAQGFVLDTAFPYLTQLDQLLASKNLVSDDSVARRLRGVGTLKLVALSGVFTGERETPLDLLLVATRTKKRGLRTALKSLEQAIGTEIAYAVFDPEEFVYRASVRDRLIRNVFEHNHRIIFNKLPSESLPY